MKIFEGPLSPTKSKPSIIYRGYRGYRTNGHCFFFSLKIYYDLKTYRSSMCGVKNSCRIYNNTIKNVIIIHPHH